MTDAEGSTSAARQRVTFWAFALVYAAAALVGRATVLPGEHVSLAWPAAGVAVLWLLQTRHGAAVLAMLAGELAAVLAATGAPPTLIVLGSVAATAQTWTVVTLVRRVIPGTLGAGGSASIHSLGVLVRGSSAVAVGCALGAAIGGVGLWLVDGSVAWKDVLLWFGRQVAGVMIVGSVGHLIWERLAAGRAMIATSTAPIVELVALWAVSAAVYAAVFLGTLPLAYTAIPLTVWCAVRCSTLTAAMHAAAFGVVAVSLTVAGRGPFATISDPAVAAILTQAFVLVTLLTALVLASVRDQREELLARLARSEATAESRARLLTAMNDAMVEGMVVIDSAGEVVQANHAAQRLLGRTSVKGAANAADYELRRADGSPMPLEERPSSRAMTEGDVPTHDVVVPTDNGRHRVISVRATRLVEGTDTLEGPAALLVYRDVTSERTESRRLAEFAEVTAHDLRSPLSTVVGWVSFASDELEEPEPEVAEAHALLRKALVGASQLGELIDNMLDQALAEGGELVLEPLELTGPDGMVEELGELLGVPDLVVHGPEGPHVLADERAVRQLLSNLLGNAVKYVSPDRPLTVTVDVLPKGSRVGVTVSDTGRGIPTGEHESIFHKFSRATTAGTVIGSGIGLSICQQVVERHGGTIKCGPGPDGVGTTFSFDLPASL